MKGSGPKRTICITFIHGIVQLLDGGLGCFLARNLARKYFKNGWTHLASFGTVKLQTFIGEEVGCGRSQGTEQPWTGTVTSSTLLWLTCRAHWLQLQVPMWP